MRADWHPRRCQVAALLLAVMHFLTVSGMAYQASLRGGFDELVINYGLWLSPILLVLLLKRACVAVGLFAIPILIDFTARVYYASQFYFFGINSIGQKGDWAFWFTTFLGMFSLGGIALFLLVQGGGLIAALIDRNRQT